MRKTRCYKIHATPQMLKSSERTNLTHGWNHTQRFHRAQKIPAKPPIMVFPPPNKQYYSFTDGTKYCWRATPCWYTSKSVTLDDLKPITFIFDKCLDAQCNYVVLFREAFAIYDAYLPLLKIALIIVCMHIYCYAWISPTVQGVHMLICTVVVHPIREYIRCLLATLYTIDWVILLMSASLILLIPYTITYHFF